MFVHVAAMSKRHVNGIMHGWIICLWCDMCIACMPVLMTLRTTCLCEFTTVSCNIEWCVWHCIWQLSKWYGAMQPSQLGLAMTQHVLWHKEVWVLLSVSARMCLHQLLCSLIAPANYSKQPYTVHTACFISTQGDWLIAVLVMTAKNVGLS